MESKTDTKRQKTETAEAPDYSVLERHIEEFGKIKWKNTVSYVTYKRTYARRLDDDDPESDTEEFVQTLYRVIRACNEQLGMKLSPQEQCEYFDIFANFKALPAGRFLWQLGTKTVEKYGLLSLQNCAFTEVKDIDSFCWVFDCLMLGSGTGYNIQRKYTDQLAKPHVVTATRMDTNDADFIVPDSREGWIALLRYLLRAHFVDDYCPSKTFTYSCICLRSKGAPIKGFGGTASGPEHLCQGITDINKLINTRASEGLKLRPIDCLDVMNLIARTVISGNVRRCLPEGTLIHTTKGLVPIEKMTTNHFVRTPGGVHEVTAVMSQGKQQLTCIETEIGHFKCTAEHKMAVWDDSVPDNKALNKYCWKKAQDLCVTDRLVHVTHTIKGDETKIDDILHSPPLDVSTAFFLGYAHGNSASCKCILENNDSKIPGSVTFHYNNFLDFFKPEEFKFFLKLNKDDFTIESPSFAKHIHNLRVSGKIPHYILQATAEIRKAYLSGYEKSKRVKNGVMKNISNNTFLYNLHSLYASLGVRTVADTIGHTLKIIDTSYVGQSLIEYFSPASTVNTIKITNICKIYDKMETYDITVKDAEQFVAGGGVLTHNSAQIAIGDSDDIEFLNAKRWDKGNIPNWRCFSNNSVVCSDIEKLPEEFWEGYKGNGECYGLINLDLSQKIGRTGETQYPDPEVTGYNPSLRAGTRVLTSDGVVHIETLENKFFKTRNLDGGWSYARCWKSGVGKPLHKLTMANGKEYFCTAEHKWPVLKAETTETKVSGPALPKIEEVTEMTESVSISETGQASSTKGNVSVADLDKSEETIKAAYEAASTPKLQDQGSTVTKSVTRTLTTEVKAKDRLPYIKSRALCNPVDGVGTYSDGFSIALLYCSPTVFVAEGTRTNYVWVLPEDAAKGDYGQLLKTWMNSVDYAAIRTFEQKDDKGNKFVVITQQSDAFTKHMSKFGLATEKETQEKTYGVPQAVWTGTEDFRRGFIDALYSFVGGVDKKQGLAFLPSPSERFTRDVWDLLGFYGVASTVKIGEKTSDGEDIVPLVVFEADIFSQMFRVTNKKKQDVLDKLEHRKQDIVGEIEVASCKLTELKEDVWDVAVYDSAHLFALSHCFTGNCGEQSLANKETCCLMELFLPNMDSQEELYKCAKNMYRIAKHSMSLPCHQKTTEAIVHKNMRMGIGITGVLQAPEKMDWLDKTYKQLREFDEKYSKEHGFPPSVKLTTVKPSGCVNPMTMIVVNTGAGVQNQTFDQIFKGQGIQLPSNEEIGDGQAWYDVTNPFQVLDEHNKMQNVVKLYDNGVRDTVHLQVDNEDIYCTPDHKFKVQDKWIQAVNLTQGDVVKFY